MPLPFKRQNELPRPFKPFVAQVKTVPPARSVKAPVAPPVYKPQAKPIAQLKKAGPPPVKTPPAPTAYRPQPTPAVLQRKTVSHQPTKPPDRKPVAPPVYRPQPSPKVLQTKKVGPQRLQNIRPTTESNTIQRSLDPVTVFVGGALLVGAIGGLVYGARKCAAGQREPEAPESPEEKKVIAITKESVKLRAGGLRKRAKDIGAKDIKGVIDSLLVKIDKSSSYEFANGSLNEIEKRISGRERAAQSSASPYAASVEGPKVRRVKVKKQEEKKERRVVGQDITPVFNRAKACVLFALARLKGGAFGVNSAERLHDLFWEQAQYEPYRQYSDISVIRALFDDPRTNMREVEEIAPDTLTMGDLPERLPAGRYAVITRSSVSMSEDAEEHMLLLENGSWLEFRGHFQEARRDDNALVRGVWQ